MKAISINGLGVCDNLELADDVVKQIMPEAVYMEKLDFGTRLFYPMEKQPENMSFVYGVDGTLYNTIWTNPYDELVEILADVRKGYQMSMELVFK